MWIWGGSYSVDDITAAEFLIAELSSTKSELSQEELENYALLLRAVLSRLEKTLNASGAQLVKVKKKAESIPTVGPLLFSTANLPGTLASVAALAHSGSKSTKAEQLFDISDDTRKRLKKWAAMRGRPGSVSAQKALRGRLKLIRGVGGHLYFEVPLNAQAKIYRIAGRGLGSAYHLPAFNTAHELRAVARIDSASYGSKGVGRVLTGSLAGGALAFGPQAYLDATNSSSIENFLKSSAYSQPTNAMIFAAGLAIGGVGATAIISIPVMLVTGVVIQLIMSDEGTGWGKSIGDFLTGKE